MAGSPACGSETAGSPCTPGPDGSCTLTGDGGLNDGAPLGDDGGLTLGEGGTGTNNDATVSGDGGNTYEDSGSGVCVPVAGV